MELRQLQYFITIARVGGFRRAAEQLSVSQTTLSQQIKLLERELGVQLFERTRRQVALTPAGSAFLDRSQKILADLRMAREEALDFAEAEHGHLKVGAITPNPMRWMPRLFAEFNRLHPNINVTLVERSSEQLVKLLHGSEVHVAWLITPTDGVPGLSFQRLFTAEFVLLAAPDHPLARSGQSSVTVEQLANQPLILPPPGPSRAIVDEAFRAHGIEPRVAFEATDPSIRIALATEGLGLALASERTPAELHRVRIEGVSMLHSAVLAWTERGIHTRAAAVFVDFAT
ncbi:MAG TPA: LysR substrate-binding domain-containing protein, partial [Chloroflexota bacterium]|nr:LysR substrate-binding domain-containing protein [Chloroflexota bacterium]